MAVPYFVGGELMKVMDAGSKGHKSAPPPCSQRNSKVATTQEPCVMITPITANIKNIKKLVICLENKVYTAIMHNCNQVS